MHEDNRKDICSEEIDYSYVSFISSKIRIGIIGGGTAGTIKAKHFIKNKCYVEVLANSFSEELLELSKNSIERLKLINEEFNYEFIKDKHLVIIAIDDKILNNKIKKYCDENFKIYIDSSNFKEGMGVVPTQRSTENITFALNTRGGNPKGSVLLINKVENIIDEYDNFIGFMTMIREKAKGFPEFKKEILDFIGNDEFKKEFDKGESGKALRLKFSNEIVESLLN